MLNTCLLTITHWNGVFSLHILCGRIQCPSSICTPATPHTLVTVSQQSHLHTGWVPVCAALHTVTPTAGCCLLTVSSRKSKASRMTFVSFQPHFCCWCFHSKITFMLLSIFVLLLIPFSSFVSEVPCSTPYFL